VDHAALAGIAQLLVERNQLDEKISAVIRRPMTSGHLGEWIAAQVFDIALESGANAAAIDGRFASGPLEGRTVNVKWYLRREGVVDMTTSEVLDDYLVFTGPFGSAGSSKGQTRPWCITNVYLFDAHKLRSDLHDRGRQIGVASSVRGGLWTAAEIYPNPANPRLPLTDEQREALSLFTFVAEGARPGGR
jgi:hypothetical protein